MAMRINGRSGDTGGAYAKTRRVRVLFKGIVQGVGFRPFIYRYASKFKLGGFVKNTTRGVLLEVEGTGIEKFISEVLKSPPPMSRIETHQIMELEPEYTDRFEIISSESDQHCEVLVSPDIAICANCANELSSPDDRRFKYPFINCTDCGPRLTIIHHLPYDRPNTTMLDFKMCETCRQEYIEPSDRRYHAQPISCFGCGPVLTFVEGQKKHKKNALEEAYLRLKEGHIVAIKGIGGYHLACLASSKGSILNLREIKNRKRKPFALMGTLEMIKQNCFVSETEREVLSSPSAPIVLLEKREQSKLPDCIAPGQNTIGFMLPYTPLHLLLVKSVDEPLVMTSANFSDEPIIFRDDMKKLTGLTQRVLTHDRRIHAFADDSVARIFENKPVMIRRSRGYVPLPLETIYPVSKNILALGAMLKTTFTLLFDDKAIVSQYIGNTDSPVSIEAEKLLIRHYQELFSFHPDLVVLDKHPEYPNRVLSQEFTGCEVVEIQHHRAHVGALLAEKMEKGRIIGISMDGTGYGDDGKIWGGEFFTGNFRNLTRFGHLRYQPLPSGEKSIKEPWRFALSLLVSRYGDSELSLRFAERFKGKGLQVMETIQKNINVIMTSSCGRWFDAIASLMGVGDFSDFDGDLPAQLQACAEHGSNSGSGYSFSIGEGKLYTLDLLPSIDEIIHDRGGLPDKAYRFHQTLARAFTEMAKIAREKTGIKKVGLTGGVFQNLLLLELTKNRLEDCGFQVLIHSEIPSNDGGISLGQAFLAAAPYFKENW